MIIILLDTCLEEEVRGLAEKAEGGNLTRKDRIKYLWKEETFKELLQQIRGQQSALSLLIQGLQMCVFLCDGAR